MTTAEEDEEPLLLEDMLTTLGYFLEEAEPMGRSSSPPPPWRLLRSPAADGGTESATELHIALRVLKHVLGILQSKISLFQCADDERASTAAGHARHFDSSGTLNETSNRGGYLHSTIKTRFNFINHDFSPHF